ncbi:MAG: M28 family peptidase [Bacteroidetes bacterium]|nr:M28 family peptidase [Bacteroidota bacterium]
MNTLAFILCFLFQYEPPKEALQFVTTEKLKQHIAVLSHDSLEGRGPSSRGDKKATAYIVSQMKQFGLLPAGENGGYLQKIPLVGMLVNPSAKFVFSKGKNSQTLNYSDDFVALPGAHEPVINVKNIPVVFVGYGIVAPEQRNWDDYKGVDVSGKILLMMNDDPNNGDPNFFAGKGRTYYGRWTYKYEIAAAKGALGAIVIHTTRSAGYPYRVIQNSFSAESFDVDEKNSAPKLRIKAWTTEEATRKYVELAGYNLDSLFAMAQSPAFKPVDLNIQLSVSMQSTVRRLETNNIIGKVEGSDPVLKNQYIVFSAHYDHFGIGRAIDGDSIYNGALDNASGTSLMLNLAETFASMNEKPKRSLLFAAVAAEEQGLLGSQYFANNPTVPIQSIAANINTDVMNVTGRTTDISFQGDNRSSLGNDIAVVAKEMGLTVMPDRAPEQGGFYRSDHFSFAKAGVPAISVGGGSNVVGVDTTILKKIRTDFGKSYHQPSDEMKDYWIYDGGIQEAEFIIRLVWRIGNIVEMPYWNPGDEFEAVRKASLKKVKR